MSDDKPEKSALKDWFDQQAVTRLATQISKHASQKQFSPDAFIATATDGLTQLEFQARVQHIAASLKKHLPRHIPTALDLLTASLPTANSTSENVTNDGWLQWPIGHFIASYARDFPDAAFQAMQELTMRFTSEFAVRPFIQQDQHGMLMRLSALTSHPNLHIRRWCSEGSRPRLPWGGHLRNLISDPTPLFPILDQLIDDPELYVRKSVANNLNDIAKDHPDLVIDHCTAWLRSKNSPSRCWIVRHALRTLIKNGHPAALSLLGYHPPQQIHTTIASHPLGIRIGDSVRLNAQLNNHSDTDQNLMIDFVVHYSRQAGKTSPKVFKWKSLILPAKQQICISKSVAFKITTIRRLYPGTHQIDLQVNGHRLAHTSLSLATE